MLNSNIPLSVDKPANLLDAVSSGFQSAEAIRNAPLMRSLLEQRVQGGQQALQAGQFNQEQVVGRAEEEEAARKGIFINRLATKLRETDDINIRRSMISQNADYIRAIGANPDQIPLDNQSIDNAIAATSVFSAGENEDSVIVKPGERLVGSKSGAEIAVGLASPEDTKEIQSKVNTLRSRADKFNADLRQVDVAFKKINSAPATAAGDLSLIFNFMKMLDPGSTVREGEFANAQNAAGVPTRIINAYNQAKDGTRLSEQQREEFKGAARSAFDSQRSGSDEQIAQLLQQADQDGVDRARVLGAKALRDFEKRAADSVIGGSQRQTKRLIFNPSTGRLE